MISTPSTAAAGLAAAVEVAGSKAALARLLGVHRTAIYIWMRGGIPAKHVPRIERITGVPRHRLRPDLWDAPQVAA
jgi:DNA-binding transcriptional regulator YdaS (Cro superfamily)